MKHELVDDSKYITYEVWIRESMDVFGFTFPSYKLKKATYDKVEAEELYKYWRYIKGKRAIIVSRKITSSWDDGEATGAFDAVNIRNVVNADLIPKL